MVEFQNTCVKQAGEMCFCLQASVFVLDSIYPIAELWEMHQSAEAEQHTLSVDEHEYLCIFRDEYQVSLRKISADLFALIAAIQQGKTLIEIAELLEDSSRLNVALEQLIKNEWLRN